MDAGWAAVVAAAVTGATAIITIVVTQRYERRRAEAERQDRHFAQLLEPRVRAHEQLVKFLVQLSRRYSRFVDYGNEFVEHSEPSEWGPLSDLEAAEEVYAANRLWLSPRVASALEDVLSRLSLGASMALALHGSPELEEQVEPMAKSIIESANACGEAARSALGIPALELVQERLAKTPRTDS